MKFWAAIIAILSAIGGVFGLIGIGKKNAKKDAKITGLQNKVKANEIENENENASDDDVTSGLSRWRK